MGLAKWALIALNEYRLFTASFRSIRGLVPLLLTAVAIVYIAFVAPAIANALMDELLDLVIGEVAVPLFQIVLLVAFLYFLMVPISMMAKDTRSDQLEIFLSAPVRPGEVVLGRFAGSLPFYGFAVAIIGGSLTAFLVQRGIGPVQMVAIVAAFVLTLFSGLWIGTFVAAVMAARIGRMAGGRDIARGIALLMVLPMIGITYFLLGIDSLDWLASLHSDPLWGTLLSLLPPSWGAELFVAYLEHPGDWGAVATDTVVYLGASAAFFLATMYLGMRAIDRTYRMEAPAEASRVAGRDGPFHRALRRMGPGSFGIVVSSMMKEYLRRYENLSKIAYTVGLLLIMVLFLVDAGDVGGMLMFMMIIMPLTATLIVGEVTMRGKEALFIYRKSPMGEWTFIAARLVQAWIVLIPLSFVTSSLLMVASPYVTTTDALLWAVLITTSTCVAACIALGLFLMFPAFNDRSGEMVVNLVGIIFLYTFLFILIMELAPVAGTTGHLLTLLSLTAVIGAGTLLIGKGRLSMIE